jgi:hypothetical protein
MAKPADVAVSRRNNLVIHREIHQKAANRPPSSHRVARDYFMR